MATSEKEILGVLGRLNTMIKHRGVVVVLGKRYGYKAFDLYHRKSTRGKGGGMIDTLKAGFTSGQALDYLYAMIKGINLYKYGGRWGGV